MFIDLIDLVSQSWSPVGSYWYYNQFEFQVEVDC